MTRTRRGRPPHPDVLTPAEWSVVHALRHGLSNRAIARLRGVSLDAIKDHVSNARAKLGLADRASLRYWRGVPAASAACQREEQVMTGAAFSLHSIGQIARAVRDIGTAERWYRDVLGLRHLFTSGPLAFFDCDGTRLMLEDRALLRDTALRNDSILYFRVPDIQAAYDELQRRGVEFAGAPHMIYRHPDGTEEWMAFFKDCDGGMLAIMAQLKRG